jgi:hypothetical protein
MLENSFSVRLVRSNTNWRVATTADLEAGITTGVAAAATTSVRREKSFAISEMVASDW